MTAPGTPATPPQTGAQGVAGPATPAQGSDGSQRRTASVGCPLCGDYGHTEDECRAAGGGVSTLEDDIAVLRRAAELARDGEASEDRNAALLGAFADWWASEAATLGEMEPFVDLLNAAIEQKSGVKGYLRFQRHEDGRIVMRSDTSSAALRAARIFLGEHP